MSHQQQISVDRRVFRLHTAIRDASRRLKDEPSGLQVNVAVFGNEYGLTDSGVQARLVVSEESHVSWRIGKESGDELFGLKFIPSLGSLVLPQQPLEGETGTPFLEVTIDDLIGIYTWNGIYKIVRKLNALKPARREAA